MDAKGRSHHGVESSDTPYAHRRYPGVDHFDIYDGPAHEAVVADEIEFLHRHLLRRSRGGTTKAASELMRVYPPALAPGENPAGGGSHARK